MQSCAGQQCRDMHGEQRSVLSGANISSCSVEGPCTPLPLGVGASGTVFRLHFLGSVEVDEEGGRKRRKRLKKNMVEVAVTKIKVCFFSVVEKFPQNLYTV